MIQVLTYGSLEEGLDRVWTPVVSELVFDTKFAVTFVVKDQCF